MLLTPVATAYSAPLVGPSTKSTESQQPDPKKKEITATVTRSVENEQIKLTAFFPDDTARIKCSLYNLLGKLIEIHPTTQVEAGRYTFIFRTQGLPNGPYIVVLEANGQRIIQKVMLAR
jgi:hypothetical protein